MRFQNLVRVSLVGSAIASGIPPSARNANVIEHKRDLPAITKAFNTVGSAIKDAEKALSNISEATIATSASSWADAGKIMGSALTTAAGQLSGTPALGIFNIAGFAAPLNKLVADIGASSARFGTVLLLGQKSKEGKEGEARFITELEPGLKAFIVAFGAQLPSVVTSALPAGISIPKKVSELDKPFGVLDRALEVFVKGGFDGVITAISKTGDAVNELVATGILDKIFNGPTTPAPAAPAPPAPAPAAKGSKSGKPSRRM
jgi:hypothetical protein